MVIVGILIIVLLVLRRRARLMEAAEDEWARHDAAEIYEDKAFERKVHVWAEEGRYDTRTLAELGSSPCPACGEDHPGTCSELESFEKALVTSDVITGTIVAVQDIPEQVPQTETLFIRHPETSERVGSLMAVLDEIENQWHNVGSGWQPPSGYVSQLPEDDWLRRLLTEDLVPA